MIDTNWHSGGKEGRRAGSKEQETPLGDKMLFAAQVKIMTHQMEHFKEIHTQLSWLSFLSILSLSAASFSLFASLLQCLFASLEEYHTDPKKHRHTSLC